MPFLMLPLTSVGLLKGLRTCTMVENMQDQALFEDKTRRVN